MFSNSVANSSICSDILSIDGAFDTISQALAEAKQRPLDQAYGCLYGILAKAGHLQMKGPPGTSVRCLDELVLSHQQGTNEPFVRTVGW